MLRLKGMILRLSLLVALTIATGAAAYAGELQMRELPRAASSSVSNITFADAPKRLPIDTRFSQAIQTVAFNLSLACRQIEAYGWTLKPSEQSRVDAIFTDAATQLANYGYVVKPQNPVSAAEDITVYTATRPNAPNDHILFMWSAGDAGLLLLMCDAKGSGEEAATATASRAPSLPENVPYIDTNPTRLVGEWMGRYTCRSQGPTTATLTITKAHLGANHDDHQLDGVFSFYPSPENPGVASGSYRVMGTYDDATQQAMFSPGPWQQQPVGYTSHPFVAYFDLQRERVSVIFQETTGCTSFEAGLKSHSIGTADAPAKKAAKKKKKTTPKKKPVPVEAPMTDSVTESATQGAPTVTVAPESPTPATTVAPETTDVVTVPETSSDTMAAPVPAPVPVPVPVETPTPTPVPAPTPTPTPAPTIAPAPTSTPAAETVPSELVVPVKPSAIPTPTPAPTAAPANTPTAGVIDVAPKAPANPNVNQTFGGLAVPPAKPIQPQQ